VIADVTIIVASEHLNLQSSVNLPLRVKVKGKGKVVLVQLLTEHHAMKAYWGVEVQLHSFFDLGTRWR
jgi:hypothetical protein